MNEYDGKDGNGYQPAINDNRAPKPPVQIKSNPCRDVEAERDRLRAENERLWEIVGAQMELNAENELLNAWLEEKT